jgi:hypothetical protein
LCCKAAFQYTITCRTFVSNKRLLFYCSLDQGIFEKAKLQLGSKCPSSFGILKTSIALYTLITTGASCIVEACLEKNNNWKLAKEAMAQVILRKDLDLRGKSIVTTS